MDKNNDNKTIDITLDAVLKRERKKKKEKRGGGEIMNTEFVFRRA